MAVAWITALVLAGATAAPSDYTIKSQTPLAVIFAAPTGKLAHATRSNLLRDLDEVLDRNTNLEIQDLDPAAMQQCRGRLTCLVLRARPDFDPKSGVSYRQHLRDLMQRKVAYPEYLLVLTAVPLGEVDRWSAVLVSTDLTLQKVSSMSDRNDMAAIESIVTETAIAASRNRVEIDSAEATKAFLDKLVQDTFQATFRRAGYWDPYGDLVIAGAPEGVTLTIDGNVVGVTKDNETSVGGLLPGSHTVLLEHPGYMSYTSDIKVERKAQARLEATMIKNADPSSSGAHKVVFWSGIGVAAAGAGVLIYSLAQGGAPTACFSGSSVPCNSGQNFIRSGYDSGATPASEVNRGAVVMAPLGYSLIGTGAAWSVGSWLTPDSDVPWLAALAGIAVGSLSYGLSAAID